MSIKLIVDMNLSPQWVGVLKENGFDAVHWSSIGRATAPDAQIMNWALANNRVVFTHDLDFGTILAVTKATGPSVIQIRTQDVMPEHLAAKVINALTQFQDLLLKGALIVVDERKSRARILPLQR